MARVPAFSRPLLLLGMFLTAGLLMACSSDNGENDGSTPTATRDAGAETTATIASAEPSATSSSLPEEPTFAAPDATATPGDGETPLPGATDTPPDPPGAPNFDSPPPTTASANGTSVEAGIGTYCWGGLCVDKIGVPTQGELTVTSGDTVTFALPQGAPPLTEVSATAFPATDSTQLDDGSTIWLYPAQTGDAIEAVIGQDGISVPIDLAPGQYVLSAFMFFNPGDIVYGVLLNVQ